MQVYEVLFYELQYGTDSPALLKSWGQSNNMSFQFDYISINDSQIDIYNCNNIELVQKGFIIHIIADNGKQFSGVVMDIVENTDNDLFTVTYRPLLELFNIDIAINVSLGGYNQKKFNESLEQNLYRELNRYRGISSDTYLRIPNISFNVLTNLATWNLPIDYDKTVENPTTYVIRNIYEDLIVSSFTKYGCIVDIQFYPANTTNQFVVDIYRPHNLNQVFYHLEIDNPNFISSSISIKNKEQDYNKLQCAIFSGTSASYINYYKYSTSTADNIQYGTENRDRIYPVNYKIERIESTEGGQTPAELAAEKASDLFNTFDYENEIIVELNNDDPVINIDDLIVGRRVRVYHKGVRYPTMVTGHTFNNNTTTIMLGTVRTKLTKKLKTLLR